MASRFAKLSLAFFLIQTVRSALVTHYAVDLPSTNFTEGPADACLGAGFISSTQQGASVTDVAQGTAVDVYFIKASDGAGAEISIDGQVVFLGASLDARLDHSTCTPTFWSSTRLGKDLTDDFHNVTVKHDGADTTYTGTAAPTLYVVKFVWTTSQPETTSAVLSTSRSSASTGILPQTSLVTPSTINQSSEDSTPKSSPAGAIAGGVVGGIFGISLIVGLIIFMHRRRNDKNGEQMRSADGSKVDINAEPIPYSSLAQDFNHHNPPFVPLTSAWSHSDVSHPTHYATPTRPYNTQQIPNDPPPPFSIPAYAAGRLSRQDLDTISRLVAQGYPPTSLAAIVDSMLATNNGSTTHGSVTSPSQTDSGYSRHNPNPPTYDFKGNRG